MEQAPTTWKFARLGFLKLRQYVNLPTFFPDSVPSNQKKETLLEILVASRIGSSISWAR